MDGFALALSVLLLGPPWPEPDPPVSDRLRFPGPDVVRLELARARRYREDLTGAAGRLGWSQEQIDDHLDRLHFLREPWDLLEVWDAEGPRGGRARLLLARLRERLGPERWWAGALPPAVPGPE